MPEETVATSSAPVVPNAPDQSAAVAAPEGEAPPATPPAAADPAAEKAAAAAKLKAKQLAEHARRESALRKANEELASQRQAMEHQTRELAQAQSQIESLRSQVVEYLGSIKQDPIGWLQREMGFGPEEYYDRALNNGKPTKEQLLAEELGAYRRELEELKGWRTQREQAEAEARERWERQQAERAEQEENQRAMAAHEQAKAAFWSEVSGNPAKYPDLLIYPQEIVVQHAQKALEAIEQNPELLEQLGVSFDELDYPTIARLLQDSTREWHEKARSVGSQAAQAQAPQAGAPVQTVPAAGDPVAAAIANRTKPAGVKRKRLGASGGVDSMPTLSGNMATRATAPAKKPFNVDEEKARIIAELNRAGQ